MASPRQLSSLRKVRRIDYERSTPMAWPLIDAMVYALDDPTGTRMRHTCMGRPGATPNDSCSPDTLSSMYTRRPRSADVSDHQQRPVAFRSCWKRLGVQPAGPLISGEDDRLTRAFLEPLRRGFVLRGEALSDWVSSDSDDLNEFVADFGRRRTDRVSRWLPLSPSSRQIARSISHLLYRLRDSAEVVVHNNEPGSQDRRGTH